MANAFNADSLRGITIFVITAQSCSFTDASEQIGITKSAVGKSIARLEARLGTSLFHRSTRKLSLTSDGEAYLQSCLSALDILYSAEHALCRHQEIPSGTVRIDMPASFGRNLMLPLLLDIATRYPALRLILTFNDSLADPMKDGVDLALRLGELQDTHELIAKRLGTQKLILCASPAYIKQHGTPENIATLKHHICIMGYRRGAPLAWRLKPEGKNEVHFTSPTAHEISDGDALLQACLTGLGIAQFPELMVTRFLKEKQLVPLLENYEPDPIDLNVIWPRTKHLFPKIRLILDELSKKMKEGYFGSIR